MLAYFVDHRIAVHDWLGTDARLRQGVEHRTQATALSRRAFPFLAVSPPEKSNTPGVIRHRDVSSWHERSNYAVLAGFVVNHAAMSETMASETIASPCLMCLLARDVS